MVQVLIGRGRVCGEAEQGTMGVRFKAHANGPVNRPATAHDLGYLYMEAESWV